MGQYMLGQVNTQKLKDGAVTHDKLAADAVEADKIKDLEIKNADISASAAIAKSKTAFYQNIVNDDIKSDAAVAASKLTLTDSITNAMVKSDAAIASFKLALTDAITNAMINSDAAIAYSKLNLTGNLVVNDLSTALNNKLCPLRGTTADFRANPGTGTITDPAYVNDGNISSITYADAVDEYVEIDFGKTLFLQKYRHSATGSNNGSGRWKLQCWDGSAFVDWVTEIPTRTVQSWSDYITVTHKLTSKIRIVCTTVDTKQNKSYIGDLEILGSD